ncbi:MAG: hypothetical protein WAT79_01965 [Saprospiraceae bacterium]
MGMVISCKENHQANLVVQSPSDSLMINMPLDSSLYEWEGDNVVLNWKDLLDVRFNRLSHEFMDSVDIPQFTPKVLALHGKKVIIEGFYIPVEETGDENIVILSAYPFAQCFFCGQAGVESIIDVLINEKLPTIKTDTKVRFSGIFKTNPDNFDFLIYILDDAVFLD